MDLIFSQEGEPGSRSEGKRRAGLFPRSRGVEMAEIYSCDDPRNRTKPVSKYTLISCRANNQARKPAIYTGERACGYGITISMPEAARFQEANVSLC